MRRLAIGIVSFERGHLTQRLLDSIASLTATPYHVFLADNGSRDPDTVALLDEWERRPATTLIRLTENTGPAGGRNALLREIGDQFDTVAMLDNDIVVLPNWDIAALRALDSGFDAVGPKLLMRDGITLDRGPKRSRREGFIFRPEDFGRGVPRDSTEVNERLEMPAVGGTAIFRSEIYHRVGGYDSRIWEGEDYDFAYRARALGFRFCYEPTCELIHDHPYDPRYGQTRSDPGRMLTSHFVIWKRHRRLLLPPSALWLYTRVVIAREPMFLDRRLSLVPILRRVRRRLMRWYAEKRLGEVWISEEQGEKATAWSEIQLAKNKSPMAPERL